MFIEAFSLIGEVGTTRILKGEISVNKSDCPFDGTFFSWS
jgi:hypothetical protein